MNRNTKGFLVFIALLSLLFVLVDIFLWINVANGFDGKEEMRSAYIQHYPNPVRNLQGLIILPLVLLTFASLFFIRSARTNFIKIAGATLAVLLAIFLIWKMFSIY
ncbi:hypothetical protein [Flavobacterium beibuense]|uniref:Uncharacterized protein n=1 Tax=Flavobacterium beibuense TaxID=657326 RepID=A0A444WDC2_9FLAO|nr:hypothetical protein [Flavobacterium beibuense]RYJ43799.1 hypothetical protein NU09_1307 [Flavobacterium beibuense]